MTDPVPVDSERENTCNNVNHIGGLERQIEPVEFNFKISNTPSIVGHKPGLPSQEEVNENTMNKMSQMVPCISSILRDVVELK